MTLAPIFDPEARVPGPKPAAVNLRTVFLIGTGIWIVALGIAAVIFFGFGVKEALLPFITCIFGVVVGLILLIWEKWYRPEYTKLAE